MAKASAKNMQQTGTSKMDVKKVKKDAKQKTKDFLKRVSKIEKLPKTVQQTIPIRGFMQNGIIETSPGVFTKSYKLDDVNFDIAPEEEQKSILMAYMDFLNSFNENIQWQFTIYNHEIDKKETIRNIRFAPQKDGLNKYRQEENTILLNALKKGNNSIRHDKYLTVSIEDSSVDHANISFHRIDAEISKKLKRISKSETRPLTMQERLYLLYDIYNMDHDYRLDTGIYKDGVKFNLAHVTKQGLSIKDIIGPPSINFGIGGGAKFMVGDMYAQALYLQSVPAFLTTSFLSDLTDIQANMLISITSEAINSQKASKMVKDQISALNARIASITEKNAKVGVGALLPPELEASTKNAQELLRDLTGRNQNLFFVTMIVVVFGRTEVQLDENIKLVKNVGSKHLCPIKPAKYQQEPMFNTALPLCRNDVQMEILYTTESASVFIPYNSQELNQKNAVFYGLNATTKNMIMYDRTTGNNYNGIIFGYSGSGKSFTAKEEMISILLNHPEAQIFIIDPQGEYYPLVKAFNGQEINLSPGSGVYLNPLDLDISEDEENDPITMKSDFMHSLFDIIIGKNRELDPIHQSLIDKCVRKLYRPYIEDLATSGETCNLDKCPTLGDFYRELKLLEEERFEAGQLADVLFQYAVGSFDTFAHRTNVNTKSRFIVYNTKNLGTGMKELGLHICLNDIWTRMIQNSKRHVYTWFYIDEFHLLLESDSTTLYLKRIWKMARKWLGVPTGIMQNTEDLLRNADTRAIVNNTSLFIMLKASLMDRQNLAELFNLSNAQLEFITDSDPGHGLIYNGKVVLPFANELPKSTNLYKIITTQHDVDGAMFG